MGNSAKKKQTNETIANKNLGSNLPNFITDVQNAYQSGQLGSQNPNTQQAIDLYTQAANQSNPLLPNALTSANNFITNSNPQNPYLQQLIDNQLTNAQNNAYLQTSTDANQAGQYGSPAFKGLFAQRFGSAAAPIVTNALSDDYAKRQALQAQFTALAPQLGIAPGEQLANQAGYAGKASDVTSNENNPYNALTRYSDLLNLKGQLLPTTTGTGTSSGGGFANGLGDIIAITAAAAGAKKAGM